MGKDSDAKNAQLSVGGSASGLAAFQAGFYAYAKVNCSQCHGSNQGPLFAVSDANAAYQYARTPEWIDFKAPADSLYELRANDGHCGQPNCVGKGPAVAPLLADWATAELTGPAGGPAGGPPPPPAGIKYFSQGVAIPATLPSGATYAVMRWQMNALAPANALMGNSIFELEIQSLNVNTYKIRNPKIVGLTAPVLMKGLHILIRKSTDPAPGAEDPLGDGWKADSINVQAKALPIPLPATPIAGAQIIDVNNQGENVLSGADFMTIAFDDLTPGSVTVPLGPTFAAIMGNLIQPKCLGCHSGAAPSAGINLSTFAGVSGYVVAGNPNTSLFYTSVVSGNPLMPQNGTPLTTAERTAISTWITNGALNN
jgi:hypothetical protein